MDGRDINEKVLSLRETEWRYRGEGNANLVLSLPQQRCVLRLRKHDSSDLYINRTDASTDKHIDIASREALFCRMVMVPLLGEAYIQPPAVVVLDQREIEQLEGALHSHRPSHRNHKGIYSHPCLTYGMLFPDYALLPQAIASVSVPHCTPTFCLEVKPKQGWVPEADRHLPRCTFCLNQFLKLRKGTIRKLSHYCPLDLFSGDSGRAYRALESLLASPQNNLKIFRDGVLVYGDGDEGSDRLEVVLREWVGDRDGKNSEQWLVKKMCALVWEVLTCSLEESKRPAANPLFVDLDQLQSKGERVPSALITAVSSLLPPKSCDWSAMPLPENSILARVLNVQQLEQVGADCVYWDYTASKQHGEYDYLQELVGGNICGQTPLHRYLLATTAKDCSIMLAFQRFEGNLNGVPFLPTKHVISDLDLQKYIFNVGVSDLDPKPASCVEKHRKRDCEVLTACLEILQCGSFGVSV